MNCKEMQNRILLYSSGELTGAEMADVERHLAECAECREYRAALEKCTHAVRMQFSGVEPSRAEIESIVSAAEGRSRRPVFLQFQPLTVRVLAYAAALALFAGGGVLILDHDGRSERIEEMSAIMSAVSPGDYETQDNEEEALYEMAEQLLILQGFRDNSEFSFLEYQDEEPAPTAFRWHSSPAFPWQRCV